MGLDKTKRIENEINKLKKVFNKIPENQFQVVEKLIDNAGFMAIELEDLRTAIAKNGCKEEYQNGANQNGYKESVESCTYTKMIKNYQTTIKQLIELLPAEDKIEAGEKLMGFVAK